MAILPNVTRIRPFWWWTAAFPGPVISSPGVGCPDVLTQPSADALAAQRNLGLDLSERNVDGQTTLPMPTVVVVDDAGVIRWIDVHPNYATRSEVADILAAVDAML